MIVRRARKRKNNNLSHTSNSSVSEVCSLSLSALLPPSAFLSHPSILSSSRERCLPHQGARLPARPTASPLISAVRSGNVSGSNCITGSSCFLPMPSLITLPNAKQWAQHEVAITGMPARCKQSSRVREREKEGEKG